MSPLASCRARLQSIIGAPVWSRSSLTSAAEISTIGADLLGGRGLDSLLLFRRDLLVIAFRRRRLLLLGRRAVLRGREVRRRRLLLAGRDAVCDRSNDQVARPDRVVVAGDDVVGLVGVAVRVDERQHRQPEPAGFTNRQLLLAQVDDEDGVGLTLHVGDAAEVLVQLLQLPEHGDALLGRQEVELAFVLQPPELVQTIDPVGDRAPVREEAAEPAMVDVRHVDALGLFLDRALALLLRADEEDRAAALGEVAGEVVRLLQQLEGLLQIDDVDAPALREDEAPHLGIPASRLVAEMNSSLQKLSHRDDGHWDQVPFLVDVIAPAEPGWNRHPSNAGTATQVDPPGWVRKTAAF